MMYERRRAMIPGTVIPESKDQRIPGVGFLNGIFAATSVLMLSQVREMTGLDTSALQNWVKRGWVSPPVNRGYNIDQVARILIINMLRDAFQLEKIAFLLAYVNGSVLDRSDDIIPESHLYEYICLLISRYENHSIGDEESLEACIEEVTINYVESIPGARNRLRAALKCIILADQSIIVRKRAEALLESFRKH